MKFAHRSFDRRFWAWVLIWSILAILVIADMLQPTADLMPYYWTPILIAASFFRWQRILLMSAVAFVLSLIDGWVESSMRKTDYLEHLMLGLVLSVVAILMSKQIQSRDERLLAMSFTDSLTSLPNRLLLYERLNFRMRQRNPLTPTVVIFLDLDNFKHVNDHYGHDVGDAMLKEVAYRLMEVIRSEDTVARLGGDEFVIMCTSIADATGAEVLCQRLTLALSEPFYLHGHDVVGGGSIGCVVFDQGDADAQRLVNLADQALREAKEFHKGGYRITDLTTIKTELLTDS